MKPYLITAENWKGATAPEKNREFSKGEKEEKIIKYMLMDPHLSSTERQALEMVSHQPSFMNQILGGVTGGALALAVAKYMKLNKSTQALLAIAGFGIGKLTVSTLRSNANPGSNISKIKNYNKATDLYEIKL